MARRTSSGWMTAGMASRGSRLLSAAVAIVIGVAFLALSLATITTAQRGMEDAVGAGLRDADLVVTGQDGYPVEASTYDEIADLPGVTGVSGEAGVSAETTSREWVYGTTVPASGVTLLEGTMPDATGQVLVNPDLAEGLAVGDDLTLVPSTDDPDAQPDPVTFTVAGLADFGEMNVLSYGPGFAAGDATLRSLDPQLGYDAVMLDLADGADASSVGEQVAGLWPDAVVQTGPEAAAERVAGLTGQTNVLAAILLGFGAVALATAAIVIANTFTITLAQRTGELALLRAVGATVGQVRRQVILEAVLLGVVASAAGVGLGLLGSWGLLALAGRLDLGIPMASGIAVTPLVVAVPLLVGIVVTVLASLWPAVRATRVSPLAALRPVGPVGEGRRVGWVRLGTAVALVGLGTALMAYAATQRDILAGVVGGLVSFVGVLVAAVVVVPAAVRALGLAARLAGAPGRLAVDNAVRNPGRAASTSAALLVGVTLITMTSIGAASAERTALGEIDSAYAVDFMVQSNGQYLEPDTSDGAVDGSSDDSSSQEGPVTDVVTDPLGPGVEPGLAAADGVQTARAVDTAYLSVDESLGATATLGLDPARDGDVVRSPVLADLVPGTVGMGNAMQSITGVEAGDVVPVHGPGGTADLRVVELAVGYDLAVNAADLARLGGDTLAPGAVLVRLADDADVGEAMAAISEVADADGLSVSGAAAERAMVTRVLDVLVLVTTALLGVAVVIAVVGIANTLSLSVVERHREHALLRGLGLTRGQMRRMLLTEGVLLAVVSAGLGLLLGVGYAVLGIQTLLPPDTAVQLAVPWTTVGLIVGVALVAGAAASVLPARRAARVSPAQGLAAA
ncbi:FtsX-like permease family protein [Ornithinimicrobium avium]|uniref:ABC transporter permease n=1 Tax=Ornithinimicrobium avium TaxID=2283195 RepID=A0A345NN40_9MICO|nr:ABC transporter permease [Ornithinimicrobium avium]AXH96448.1 ABC transporter permease [Ornithinimicrobium avium]